LFPDHLVAGFRPNGTWSVGSGATAAAFHNHSPAQLRFPGAVRIGFNFPWPCRRRRGTARSLSRAIGWCRQKWHAGLWPCQTFSWQGFPLVEPSASPRSRPHRFSPGHDNRPRQQGRPSSLSLTAPGILRLIVTLRAKKRENSSSARRYGQIRFRFHTAWTHSASVGRSLADSFSTARPWR
jgi:hypothetical protein